MEHETLTEIGLSNNEAKVYLSLLENGNTTITNVAKDCGIHRSNVYDSIKRLVDKGLVSHIQRNDGTYYEACDPQFLLRLVKAKENMLKKILPKLALKKQLSEDSNEARIYEGLPAFVNLLYTFLDYRQPILVYGIPKEAPFEMKTKIPHFHEKRISLGIPMKHIYNHDAADRIAYLNSLDYTEARSLPENLSGKVSTNICGDQVILALWSKPVISIQITNKIVADSYREHFEVLWSHAG